MDTQPVFWLQACWSDVRKFGQDSRLVEGAKMAHAQLYHFHTMVRDRLLTWAGLTPLPLHMVDVG